MKYIIDITEEQKNALESLIGVDAEEVEEVEDVEGKEAKKEWPEVGNTYYHIGATGYINTSLYQADNFDKLCKKIGNFFKSEEEAKFAAERLKVIEELKQFAEKDRPWDRNNGHYFIFWACTIEKLSVGRSFRDKTGGIYFASRKDAEDAIKAVREDRIKKYYLGMEK